MGHICARTFSLSSCRSIASPPVHRAAIDIRKVRTPSAMSRQRRAHVRRDSACLHPPCVAVPFEGLVSPASDVWASLCCGQFLAAVRLSLAVQVRAASFGVPLLLMGCLECRISGHSPRRQCFEELRPNVGVTSRPVHAERIHATLVRSWA